MNCNSVVPDKRTARSYLPPVQLADPPHVRASTAQIAEATTPPDHVTAQLCQDIPALRNGRSGMTEFLVKINPHHHPLRARTLGGKPGSCSGKSAKSWSCQFPA